MQPSGSIPEQHVHIQQSPYESWFNVDFLRAESRRILALPPPFANVAIIERWRRKQVWLIAKRIKEIEKRRKYQ